METKFQTSFIPKKPLVGEARVRTKAGTSIFMMLAVILFIASLAGVGFVIAWKGVLMNTQSQDQADLTAHEKLFDVSTIQNLQEESTKITLAKQILASHLAVSEIFTIIGGLTIDGVRFTSLDYTAPNSTNTTDTNAQIVMKGIANSFSSIAWQSDVFSASQKYGTNLVLKNPILSGLAVEDNGYVDFDFTADITPSDISYAKVIGVSSGATPAAVSMPIPPSVIPASVQGTTTASTTPN